MARRIRIGFDFDGTLTNWPSPIANYMRNRRIDAPCRFFDLLILRIVERLPVVLNGPLIDSLPSDIDIYIISARKTVVENARKQLSKYPFWKEFICRGSSRESEHEFKIRIVKKLKIKYFFDDRLSTLQALRNAGIEAIDIKEVKKYL